MTTRAAEETAGAPATRWPRWALTRWVGWALLACFALLVVVAAVTGERVSSYDDLRHAVASGDVDEVTVTGGLSANAHGASTVEVRWSSGLIDRVSTVVEARPRSAGPAMTGDLRVVRSVEDDLTAVEPDLTVHHDDQHGYSEVLGWRLPSWAGGVCLVAWLGTLFLLVGGPAPWRANRWAWFWFILLAQPVGLLGYLLLGGPTWLFPPRTDETRLRGGQGFLLALLTGAVLGAFLVGTGTAALNP